MRPDAPGRFHDFHPCRVNVLNPCCAWQGRLVTAHELYRAMRILAAYPETLVDATRAPSIFDEMSPSRTCHEAGVPEVYCACRQQMG